MCVFGIDLGLICCGVGVVDVVVDCCVMLVYVGVVLILLIMLLE